MGCAARIFVCTKNEVLDVLQAVGVQNKQKREGSGHPVSSLCFSCLRPSCSHCVSSWDFCGKGKFSDQLDERDIQVEV